MKGLPSSFFRIACLLIFLQTIMACDKLDKMYESRNDAGLAKATFMQRQEIPQIGAVCNLSTSWREGRLYYIFTAGTLVNPKAVASKSFIRSIEGRFGRPTFIAKMIDRDGFEILSIEMTEAIRIVDNDNKALGLQQKSNIECSRKKYQDISRWEIVWRY